MVIVEQDQESPVTNENAISRKNPFEVKRKQTIRRYPDKTEATQRKGLNKPDYSGNSPLDLLFRDLGDCLSAENDSVDSLYGKFFENQGTASISPFQKRYDLVVKMLDYLKTMARLSAEKKMKNKMLISISLHDMKTFSKLVNSIIVYGIYPSLSSSNGIPINKRRLNEFKSNQSVLIINKVENSEDAENLLRAIYATFFEVFNSDNDVKELLIRGTGYTDFLVISIDLLTNKRFKSSQEELFKENYIKIEKLSETYELYSIYSLLLTTESSVPFKQFVSSRISFLPTERYDGVKTLIEFIVGLREDEEVNIDKFQNATNILLAKPKSVGVVAYFTNIGNKLYDILVMINRPVLASAACFTIEELFRKNKKIVADFIFKKIWLNFNPEIAGNHNTNEESILVGEAELNNAVNVLLSITKKSSPELLLFLMKPVILSLWEFLIFLHKTKRPTEIVLNVLISFFTITDDLDSLDFLVQNLLSNSRSTWQFSNGANGLPIIERFDKKLNKKDSLFDSLDVSIKLLMKLFENINEELIQKEFLIVLKRWLKTDAKNSSANIELAKIDDENPFDVLIDLRILESISSNFNEKLSRSPTEMLEIVESILISHEKKSVENSTQTKKSYEMILSDDQIGDSDDEEDSEEIEESLVVILELLSAILSETSSSDLSAKCFKKLEDIKPHLLVLSKVNKSAKSLYDRISIILEGKKPVRNDRELEERTLSRAITSLNDPLVPIRAHGLYLLRELIQKGSPVVSIDFAINLHLNQIKDPDPFIYLNAIKGLESIMEMSPSETVPLLTGIYAAQKEDEYTLDEKLRVGEVLRNFIEFSNEAFQGTLADTIVSTTLSIVRKSSSQPAFDNKLRMSAMSLMGICFRTNPTGLMNHIADALDCSFGILNFETTPDESIMRRSGIILIHDLIVGSAGLQNFPKTYGKETLAKLRYCSQNDCDLLVRDQAEKVLQVINEIFKETMLGNQDLSSQYSSKLKIIS